MEVTTREVLLRGYPYCGGTRTAGVLLLTGLPFVSAMRTNVGNLFVL